MVLKINPPAIKFIIFSGGGGLLERIQKVHLNPGLNVFELENVPAAFDPSTTSVFFPQNESDVVIIQVDVKRPDKKIVDNFINREKQAANNIIQNATDLRGSNRDMILQLIESAHYRRYEDMPGLISVSIEAKKEQEISLGIRYFLEDSRIKWEPSLHIKINEGMGTATIEGYILVMNNTDINYSQCELAFAEFERQNEAPMEEGYLMDLETEQAAQSEMPKQRMVQQMKKMKNLLI